MTYVRVNHKIYPVGNDGKRQHPEVFKSNNLAKKRSWELQQDGAEVIRSDK